jgi:hypothetical protein
MRRAERKLKLSHNIIGEGDATDGKGEDPGNEATDMRSIIFGLHCLIRQIQPQRPPMRTRLLRQSVWKHWIS